MGPHLILESAPGLKFPPGLQYELLAQQGLGALHPHWPNWHYRARHYYYLSQADLQAPPLDSRYKLRPVGEGDLRQLEAVCEPGEIADGDVDMDDRWLFGAWEGDRLVAVSSAADFRGLYDIGVLTHPAYRGAGLGGAMVGLMTRHLWAEGLIPLYRAYTDLGPSNQLARRLGFQHLHTKEKLYPPS
jgi:RimJ/RimL family protein N-acetyltransferase